MAQRRFHKKSRHGCAQCKQNRTKCDEKSPTCGRCQRIGVACSLASQPSGLIFIAANPAERESSRDTIITAASRGTNTSSQRYSDNSGNRGLSPVPRAASPLSNNNNSNRNTSFGLAATPDNSSSNSHDSNNTWNNLDNNNHYNYYSTPNDTPNSNPDDLSAASLAPVVTDIERARLKLLAHYTQHTAQSITDFGVQNGDSSLWRDWVVELAFENDFLLYGVLGLSALHLALQCDSSDTIQKHHYTILAIQHYDRGIALFRSHLTDIDSVSQNALFGFGVIVALYSFGIQRGPASMTSTDDNSNNKNNTTSDSSSSSSNSIAKLHQALSLIRSSSFIAKREWQALQRGRWAAMMVPIPDRNYKLPDAMEDMLAKLVQYTSKTISTSTQQEMYMSCIQALRTNLALAVKYDRAQGRVSYLAVMSPPEFWSMVCIGEPLALAILANFAVILHWLRHTIWLRGWGRETVEAVREVLPVEWHECIAWAVQETEIP